MISGVGAGTGCHWRVGVPVATMGEHGPHPEAHMRRRILCCVVLMSLAACSAGDDHALAADQAEESDGDSESDAGGGAFDSGVSDDAGGGFSWWRLDADLEIVGGVLTPDASTLQAALLDDTGAELCVLAGVPGSAPPFLTLPDELLVAWWSLEAIGWSGDCIDELGPAMLPVTFSLGVGAMHPEIVAVLDGMPEASGDATEALNGAFAQFGDGETIYVFGAVGPAAAWAGEGDPSEEAPLADGVWELRGAYGFPL